MRRPHRARRGPARLLALAIAAFLALLAARAGAEEPESETHIRQGVDLRRAGRNGEALVEFQKAFALDPSPRARAQIGLALQALGDWVGAERWLQEAIEAKDDEWIERYRPVLDGALATIGAHLGRLFVETNVADAEVAVNGATPQPASGAAIRVLAGTVDVVVRAQGYAEARRRIEVAPDGEAHESFRLDPVPVAPPLQSVPAIVDTSPHTRNATAGYVLLATTAVLTGGGVAAWMVHQSEAAVWDDDSVCLVAGAGTREQQCGSYRRGANDALGVEIGAFVAALASAGASAWFLWPSRSGSTSASSWCAPSGGSGIACGGRF
jgi:hypothetical protein